MKKLTLFIALALFTGKLFASPIDTCSRKPCAGTKFNNTAQYNQWLKLCQIVDALGGSNSADSCACSTCSSPSGWNTGDYAIYCKLQQVKNLLANGGGGGGAYIPLAGTSNPVTGTVVYAVTPSVLQYAFCDTARWLAFGAGDTRDIDNGTQVYCVMDKINKSVLFGAASFSSSAFGIGLDSSQFSYSNLNPNQGIRYTPDGTLDSVIKYQSPYTCFPISYNDPRYTYALPGMWTNTAITFNATIYTGLTTNGSTTTFTTTLGNRNFNIISGSKVVGFNIGLSSTAGTVVQTAATIYLTDVTTSTDYQLTTFMPPTSFGVVTNFSSTGLNIPINPSHNYTLKFVTPATWVTNMTCAGNYYLMIQH